MLQIKTWCGDLVWFDESNVHCSQLIVYNGSQHLKLLKTIRHGLFWYTPKVDYCINGINLFMNKNLSVESSC